jgi:hypothetical protein
MAGGSSAPDASRTSAPNSRVKGTSDSTSVPGGTPVRATGGLRRAATSGLGVAAALVLVAACGSSSSSSPGTSASPTSAAVVPTTAAPPTTAAAAPAACTTAIAPTVTGSGPADTASAGVAVATDYRKFFEPTTPAATKLGLLQNGTALEAVLQGFASNKLASAATVTVTAVDFTGATAADVTYNLCESGAAVLPDSAGKSVLVGGVWQVADATLCGLVKLNNGGAAVPGCA